jgi:hypothetical protein
MVEIILPTRTEWLADHAIYYYPFGFDFEIYGRKFMKEEQKLEFLKSLGTKQIVEKIHELEEELTKKLYEESTWRSQNSGYLASYGEDCTEVKAILAELVTQAPLAAGPPTADPDNSRITKKMTVAETDAWLRKQRTKNKDLMAAINRQNNVTFIGDNNKIAVSLAKTKLESLKSVLALKTAQIEFLTEK